MLSPHMDRIGVGGWGGLIASMYACVTFLHACGTTSCYVDVTFLHACTSIRSAMLM